jgi:hypothetical protein
LLWDLPEGVFDIDDFCWALEDLLQTIYADAWAIGVGIILIIHMGTLSAGVEFLLDIVRRWPRRSHACDVPEELDAKHTKELSCQPLDLKWLDKLRNDIERFGLRNHTQPKLGEITNLTTMVPVAIQGVTRLAVFAGIPTPPNQNGFLSYLGIHSPPKTLPAADIQSLTSIIQNLIGIASAASTFAARQHDVLSQEDDFRTWLTLGEK